MVGRSRMETGANGGFASWAMAAVAQDARVQVASMRIVRCIYSPCTGERSIRFNCNSNLAQNLTLLRISAFRQRFILARALDCRHGILHVCAENVPVCEADCN